MPDYLQDRFIDPRTLESAGTLRQRRDSLDQRIQILTKEYNGRLSGRIPSTEDDIEELAHIIRPLVDERDLIRAKLIGLSKITRRYDPEPGKTPQSGISTGPGRTYWKNNRGSAKPRGD
jgi:hypothetical protein